MPVLRTASTIDPLCTNVRSSGKSWLIARWSGVAALLLAEVVVLSIRFDSESLDGLVHEVDRLEEIVSRLLQFSRTDAQDLVPGDLNTVVADAARLATGVAELNHIQIAMDLDPDLPPVAMAPPAIHDAIRGAGDIHWSDNRAASRSQV